MISNMILYLLQPDQTIEKELTSLIYRVSQKDIVFRKRAKFLNKWPFRGVKGVHTSVDALGTHARHLVMA